MACGGGRRHPQHSEANAAAAAADGDGGESRRPAAAGGGWDGGDCGSDGVARHHLLQTERSVRLHERHHDLRQAVQILLHPGVEAALARLKADALDGMSGSHPGCDTSVR